jgi:chemosensory pili system protein ChpA (sensor histidine kinase/response regulator)
MDEAFAVVTARLAQYFEAPATNVSALDEAREELHRTLGVFTMIRLDGVAAYCREIELVFAELQANPGLTSPLYRTVLNRAILGLSQYMDQISQGADNAALRLFPKYEAMQHLRGMEMSFEQDLFFPNLAVPLPQSVIGTEPPQLAASRIKAAHPQYQQGLLLWLRQNDVNSALPLMQQAIDTVMACVPADSSRAFWWISSAMLDCVKSGELDPELNVRKLLSGIDRQMRAILKDTPGDVQSLIDEMLYLIGRSACTSPRVIEVKECYALDLYFPALSVLSPNEEKQSLEELRGQLQEAEEDWEQCVAGNKDSCAKFVNYVEKIAEKSDRLEPNSPNYLTKKIELLADSLRNPEFAKLIADDVAMALVLWRSGMNQHEALDARFQEQAHILADQIDAAMSKQPEDEKRSMSELVDMYGQTERGSVTNTLANEMLTNLELVEQGLNAFFIDSTNRAELPALMKLLVQVHGGLRILSLEQAEQLLIEIQGCVKSFSEGTVKPKPLETQALANAMSALHDYLQHLHHGQQDNTSSLLVALVELSRLHQVVTPVAAPLASKPVVAAATEDQGPAGEDMELLAIFLEEANEVLAIMRDNIEISQWRPENQETLVTICRGFHTLKGSGRMVGLTDIGEVAWAAERASHKWLNDKKIATPGFLKFVETAVNAFAIWVAELEKHGRVNVQGDDVVALALQIEQGNDTGVATVEAVAPVIAPVEVVKPEPVIEEPESVMIGHISLSPTLFKIASEEASQNVLALRKQYGELCESQPQLVQYDFMRAAHTLAGICRSLGFMSVVDLAAALEGWLQAHIDRPVSPSVEQLRMLGRVIAALDEMVVAICAKQMPVDRADMVQLVLGDKDKVISEIEEIAAAAELEEAIVEPVAVETEAAPEAVEEPVAVEAVNEEPVAVEAPVELEEAVAELVAVEAEPVAIEAETAIEAVEEPIELEDAIAEPVAIETAIEEPVAVETEPVAIEAEAAAEAVEELVAVEAEPVALEEPAELEAAIEEMVAVEAVPVAIEAVEELVAVEVEPVDVEAEPVAVEAAEPVAVEAEPVAVEAVVEEAVEAIAEPVAVEAPAVVAPVVAVPAEAPKRAAKEQKSMMRDDVDAQLLPVFLEEADELCPSIGAGLRAMRANPEDENELHLLYRLLHTLKGSARMTGAMRMGEIAHEMEGRLVAGTQSKDADLWDELESDFDYVNLLLEELRTGKVAPVLTAEMNRVVAEEAAAEFAEGTELPALHVGAERTQVASMLRVRSDVIDRLVNQAGEISVARSRMETELRAFKDGLMELTGSVTRLRKQLREVEIQAESQIQARISLSTENDEQFDPLEFDRFTRLQELTRFMNESVHDVQTVQQSLLKNIDETNSVIFAQARLNRELQQNLMNVRMVPFGSMSERLYRLVRQTAKELNKRANLELTGTGVELDRSVLEKMTAPFEHLLRNAIAHGMEDEQVRVRNGKAAIGEVKLNLRQENNEVIFEFSDDGKGLNFAALRQEAIYKGLLEENDNTVTDDQIAQLIFTSGISTAREVTEVAGRGIGMDVVRSEITALGGRIDVSSKAGQGTQFTIHLPLTLAVTQVLMVRAGETVYAIPSTMIELVRQVKPTELAALYAAETVEWEGNSYPFNYLATLLGNDDHVPESQKHNPLLLLRNGNQRVALHVDQLIGNREAVVKNIGPQLSRMPGIAGATVLGDGSVVLILNPVQMTRRVAAVARKAHKAEEVVLNTKPLIMVVDDSLTVRKITTRMLTRAGYQVITATDGVDALEQLTEIMPVVMLLDVEMPRMDGFELTKLLRRDVKTAKLPIIMITSRTADKHRDHALQLGVNVYLGKPFQEEALLAQIAGFVADSAGK